MTSENNTIFLEIEMAESHHDFVIFYTQLEVDG